jgi:hypothetical protein
MPALSAKTGPVGTKAGEGAVGAVVSEHPARMIADRAITREEIEGLMGGL